jgi:hypothetical protein
MFLGKTVFGHHLTQELPTFLKSAQKFTSFNTLSGQFQQIGCTTLITGGATLFGG